MITAFVSRLSLIVENISTIFTHQNKLYVGLNQGQVTVYEINRKKDESIELTYLQSISVTDSLIEQISYIAATNSLTVLSAGVVHLCELDAMAAHSEMKEKGVSLIRTFEDTAESLTYLVMGIKRRLVIYLWQNSEFKWTKGIDLADRVQDVIYMNGTFIIGLNSEFVSLNLKTFESSSLCAPNVSLLSYFGNPKVWVGELDDGAILVKDMSNVIVNREMEIVSSNIKFSSVVDAIKYVFPYLVVVTNKGIEISDNDTGSVFQHIPLIGVLGTAVSGSDILFATNTTIHVFQLNSFDSQLKQLSMKQDIANSITLLNKLSNDQIDNRIMKLRDLYIKKAELLFKDSKYNEAMYLFSEYIAAPSEVLQLFPSFISGKQESFSVFNDVSLNELESDETSDTKSIISHNRREKPSVMKAQNSKKFRRALKNLLLYLADIRRIVNKLLTDTVLWKEIVIDSTFFNKDITQIARDIDTSLFLCYLVTNPSMIGPLLRVKNYCDSEIVKEKLSERNMYKELLDFYYNKSYHEESLTLLYNLGANKKDVFFKGAEATVQYLQKLDNEYLDLIFKFCKWPISIDLKYGSAIFINDSLQNETFDKPKVLKFLLENETFLAIGYIEHLIEDYNFTDSGFHTKLCELYISQLTGSPEPKEEFYDKLYLILDTTSYYEPLKVLSYLPTDKYYLKMHTLIYKRMKEHNKSLDIFIYELEDYEAAISYCCEIYNDDQKVGERWLHKLLCKYLVPKKPHKANYEQARTLMRSQGSKLSLLDALSVVPSNFPIKDMVDFLNDYLKSLTQVSYNRKIVYNLNKVELVKLQEELLERQQSSIVVNEFKLCKICGKKLGNSVLAYYPDDTVVHYGCAQKI